MNDQANEQAGSDVASGTGTAVELPVPELPEGTPEERAVRGRAHDWGVDEETAVTRIKLQDAGAAISQHLRDQYPEVFGSRSIGSQGEVVYSFTEEAPELETAIIDAYERAGVGEDHLRFAPVEFTEAEILERQRRAGEVLRRVSDEFNITNWGAGTDATTGVTTVDVPERNEAFEAAVRDAVEHEVEFELGGIYQAPGPARDDEVPEQTS